MAHARTRRVDAATLAEKRREADELAAEREAQSSLPLGDAVLPRGRDALREG